MALLEATRELNARLDLYKEPLLLKISGLGSFGKNVVFAEIVEKEELRKIAGNVAIPNSLLESVISKSHMPDYI